MQITTTCNHDMVRWGLITTVLIVIALLVLVHLSLVLSSQTLTNSYAVVISCVASSF